MIQVIIKENNQQILEIQVSGHADSAKYGKDLVCAGVSTTCVGIANALVNNHFLDQGRGTIDVQEGFVKIKVNQFDEVIQVVLETLETTFETMVEDYGQFIKISKVEV